MTKTDLNDLEHRLVAAMRMRSLGVIAALLSLFVAIIKGAP
jgi:hypothetical protein